MKTPTLQTGLKFTSLTSTGWVKILAWSFACNWSKRARSKILKGVNCISRRVSCCLICSQHTNQKHFKWRHIKQKFLGDRWGDVSTCSTPTLPPPSSVSPACGLAPAAAGLSPGHGGGDAIPSAVPLVPCSPLRFAPEEEEENKC